MLNYRMFEWQYDKNWNNEIINVGYTNFQITGPIEELWIGARPSKGIYLRPDLNTSGRVDIEFDPPQRLGGWSLYIYDAGTPTPLQLDAWWSDDGNQWLQAGTPTTLIPSTGVAFYCEHTWPDIGEHKFWQLYITPQYNSGLIQWYDLTGIDTWPCLGLYIDPIPTTPQIILQNPVIHSRLCFTDF